MTTTTRPSYVPSYVPHHCEIQNSIGYLCGKSPVILGYLPLASVESAMADLPKIRSKWACEDHLIDHNLGTLEEIFE